MANQWTGRKLRQARKAKGLTQQAVADMVGVTATAVGNWENEVSSPTYSNNVRLGQVLAGDPAPDNLTQLRTLVEAQARVVLLLAEEAAERLEHDAELASRIVALEAALARRQQP